MVLVLLDNLQPGRRGEAVGDSLVSIARLLDWPGEVADWGHVAAGILQIRASQAGVVEGRLGRPGATLARLPVELADLVCAEIRSTRP